MPLRFYRLVSLIPKQFEISTKTLLSRIPQSFLIRLSRLTP
jgi:hypothetical protein